MINTTVIAQLYGEDAPCDPFLLAIIIYHELQHTAGPYGSLDDAPCGGEWVASARELEYVCSIVEFLAIEVPSADTSPYCEVSCEIITWMRRRACPSHTIPSPCPSCPPCS